ncbi:hypothetical protein GCM10008904_00920 [Paraclostridium ghonii]|uniref:Uncharacterized protein n=1 Tax=Paraclostridium ghonii TaxID=29358 RepID=A0ABU0N460_9FIRM|nr:botulinum/tetanus neurotoxin translocation domain-containing protein [Paeniclostridium ghonii]MDQ0557950.1 hypothetical protein [Paeniclostridium ghonii]
MTDIIANLDKKDVYTAPNTDYFKNFKFPKKKINKDGVVIDRTTLPEINDSNRFSKEPPIPDNDTTIQVNKLTTYHYLEAQKVKNDKIKLKMVAPKSSKNLDESDSCVIEAIQDDNKIYTPFTKTADTFNNGLSRANDFLLFQSWLKDMDNAFSQDATTIQKLETAAKETLYYVPYLGQLLAVGRDIGEENYEGALGTISFMIFLYLVPELSVPVILGFEIYKEIQTIDEYEKTVDKVIEERNKTWHSAYRFMVHQWYENVHIQIKYRLNHIYQALSYQAEAIKNGVDIEFNKYSGPDKSTLQQKVNEFKASIDTLVMKAMCNAEEFLEKSSIAYFEKKGLPKLYDYLQAFDKDTKSKIEDFKRSSESKLLQQGIGSLEIAIANEDIDRKVKNEILPIKFNSSLLKSLMKSDTLIEEIVLEEDLVFSLGVRDGIIGDLSQKRTKLTIGTDIRVVKGRDNEAIYLKSTPNSSIQIDKNTNLNFLNSNNFSLSFWIRVPRYNKFDKEKDLNNEYTVVNNMDSTKGFKISIKNGILYWTLKGSQIKTVEIPLSDTKVSDNIWRHVVISNNKAGNCTIYVDRVQKGTVSLSGLGDITNNLPITLKLVGNNNKNQFIRLDQFNIYKRDLNSTEVKMLFDSYFKDEELRDYWGEPLAYNKKYYMQNIAFLGCGLQSTSDKLSLQPKAVFDPTGNGSYIPRLYRGYDVFLQKDSQNKTTDITPKKDHLINIKQESKFVGFKSVIDTEVDFSTGLVLKKYLKLTTAYGNEATDPKNFKLMSLKKDNWIQIKKESWTDKGGRIVPNGLVGKKPEGSDVYLYLWDWSNEKDDYSEKQWCFICEDEGWKDSNGKFETA